MPTVKQRIASKAKQANIEAKLKERVKELEALVDMQAEQIERFHKPKFRLPSGKRSGSKGKRHCRVAIPDTHGCNVDPKAIAAFLGDLDVIKPAEIVMLGDHLECGGFLAQHHTLGYVAQTGYTFEDDVAACNQLLDSIQKAAPKASIDYLEGNHECLKADHEVLTRDGWIPIAKVTEQHIVATMDSKQCVSWQNPISTVAHDYSGDLVTVKNKSRIDFAATKNHRFLLYSQSGKQHFKTGQQILDSGPGTTFRFASCAKNPQPEFPITDAEIQLTAWLMTDGSINDRLSIFQSKKENFDAIRLAIRDSGFKWNENTRTREARPIDGVSVATAKPSVTFSLDAESTRQAARRLFGIEKYHRNDRREKAIPFWVSQLSSRQFRIFLDTAIAADGTRSGGAWTLYGPQGFLEAMQAIICVNGFRVSLSEKTSQTGRVHWCLNITDRDNVKLAKKQMTTEPFEGKVYCLTMPNGNFIVRHKGRVHVTGNSRIEKWCVTQTLRNRQDSGLLRKMFCADSVLSLEKRKINWIRQGVFYDGLPIPATIRRGHCHFTHGSSTAKHAASVHVQKFGGNVVYGHTHRADSYIIRTVKDGSIGGWSPGCLCLLQPLWQHTNPTDWSHGYGLQLVNDDGSFLHINVPIVDGKSYLEPLVKAIA